MHRPRGSCQVKRRRFLVGWLVDPGVVGQPRWCSTTRFLKPASTQVLARVGWAVVAWSSRSMPMV